MLTKDGTPFEPPQEVENSYTDPVTGEVKVVKTLVGGTKYVRNALFFACLHFVCVCVVMMHVHVGMTSLFSMNDRNCIPFIQGV